MCEILSKHSSYRAVHGFSIVANESENFPSIKHMNHYMMWSNSASHLESRLKKINKTGLTYFSVRRTAELIEDLNYVGLHSDVNFNELLVSHLSMIKGRVKKISTMFLIRPYPCPELYNIPKSFDWIGGQDWIKAHNIYVKAIQSILKLQGCNIQLAVFWQEKILSEYMMIRFGGSISPFKNKVINLYNKTILKGYVLILLAVNYKYLRFINKSNQDIGGYFGQFK